MSTDKVYFSIGQLAKRYDCKSQDISRMLYRRVLDDSRCPRIADRRAVPQNDLFVVEMALKRAGYISKDVGNIQ